MISQFTKQLQDERKARSQFHEGGYVAMVTTHWERRIVAKKRIAKVYANGNFILEGPALPAGSKPQQWKPRWDGRTAQEAGAGHGYHRDHLEPWTAEIVAEIAGRRADRALKKRIDRVIEHLTARKLPSSYPPAAYMDQIETLLGLAPLEPEAKPAIETE